MTPTLADLLRLLNGATRFVRWAFREHRPHSPLDLLAPALLAEVSIQVRPNGDRALYVSKTEVGPEGIALIVRAIMDSGMDLARQHNIKVEFNQGGKK